MDKLNRCKFCHFEESKPTSSTMIQVKIRGEIVSEQNNLIWELEKENKLLKQVLRELL